MEYVVIGIVSFLIGGAFGVLAMSLCVASGRASRAEEELQWKYNQE